MAKKVDTDEDDAFRKEIEGSVKGYRDSVRKRRDFWKHVSRVTVVGWLFVIPVVAGAYLGRYLDTTYATQTSWTITLMLIGIAVGAINAWRFLH